MLNVNISIKFILICSTVLSYYSCVTDNSGTDNNFRLWKKKHSTAFTSICTLVEKREYVMGVILFCRKEKL